CALCAFQFFVALHLECVYFQRNSHSIGVPHLKLEMAQGRMNKNSVEIFGGFDKKSYLCRAFAYSKACDN
ncbi:MAG: hypothetical protein J6V87_07480, partial [Prevotella sp.]|nr:hypothetical protein [Prevotella sp.]